MAAMDGSPSRPIMLPATIALSGSSFRRSRALIVGLSMIVAACTSSSGDGDPLSSSTSIDAEPNDEAGSSPSEPPPGDSTIAETPTSIDEPAETDDDCEQVRRINVVRQRSVPGGRQLHLALTGDGETAVSADLASCLEFEDERLGRLEAAAEPSPLGAGATLIVAPWNSADLVDVRTFIDQYAEAAPSNESIAVWSWTDDLRQVVGATTDRQRLADRLDAVPAIDRDALISIEDVADAAGEIWEDLADEAMLGLRSIVFVAPDFAGDELPDLDRDVVTDYWWTAVEINDRTVAPTVEDDGQGNADQSSGAADADDVASAAARRIAEMIAGRRSEPLVRVGFCDDGGDLDLTIRSGSSVDRSVGIGDAADEHVGRPCDPLAAASFEAPGMAVLDVVFDDEQRVAYDAAVASADALGGRDRLDPDAAPDPEWTGTVTSDGAGSPAPFVADFRGQSTIECARRSWSIDFDGADARHLFPGSGADEFILVSMCADPGYVHQIIGASVMHEFGVWNLESATVELRVDGESQGVYLAIEKLDDELRNDRTGVTSIVRRGYDIADIPTEVEYADDGVDAIARYDAVLAATEGVSGDGLVTGLSRVLDLDQYLRWIAVNVALGSGDYIDEVFFIAENSVDEAHEVTDFYTVHGWDPDGIFSACHRDGRFEIDDPNGLLVCTESVLDQRIFADPVIYDRYVDTLEDVLVELEPGRFEELSVAAAESVTRWFADTDVLAAMVEMIETHPERLDPVVAAEYVDTIAADLSEQYGNLRAELLDRIALYRNSEL